MVGALRAPENGEWKIENRGGGLDAAADIRRNLAEVRARIAAAAAGAGRSPEEICLVAVTKNRSAQDVGAALAAGVTDVGENRAQEMVVKQAKVDAPARWHFIGGLQRNKVKQVVGAASLIQSVDRLELATEIDLRAAQAGIVQPILVQVNVSREPTKQGVDLNNLEKLVAEIGNLGHIKIDGLMTIGPPVSDPESVRPVFADLKEAYDSLSGRWAFTWLSMGMTDDFQTAVEEGSNMVRIGRAIFSGSVREVR